MSVNKGKPGSGGGGEGESRSHLTFAFVLFICTCIKIPCSVAAFIFEAYILWCDGEQSVTEVYIKLGCEIDERFMQ